MFDDDFFFMPGKLWLCSTQHTRGETQGEAEHNNQVDEIFRREANREQSTAGVKEGRAKPPPPPPRNRGGWRERSLDAAETQSMKKQSFKVSRKWYIKAERPSEWYLSFPDDRARCMGAAGLSWRMVGAAEGAKGGRRAWRRTNPATAHPKRPRRWPHEGSFMRHELKKMLLLMGRWLRHAAHFLGIINFGHEISRDYYIQTDKEANCKNSYNVIISWLVLGKKYEIKGTMTTVYIMKRKRSGRFLEYIWENEETYLPIFLKE